ncbi:MAG: hypothetical protein ACREFS_01270 [Acetobacteraceae bacterium]
MRAGPSSEKRCRNDFRRGRPARGAGVTRDIALQFCQVVTTLLLGHRRAAMGPDGGAHGEAGRA